MEKGELEHEAAWDFRDDHDDVHAPHVHVLLCPQLDGHSFPLMMAGSHPGGRLEAVLSIFIFGQFDCPFPLLESRRLRRNRRRL
jgi:hypothetical protein